MSPADEMATKMVNCFDMKHRSEIGMAISKITAFYLDTVVGGSQEHKERGVELFNATVRAYLFNDPSALDEFKKKQQAVH